MRSIVFIINMLMLSVAQAQPVRIILDNQGHIRAQNSHSNAIIWQKNTELQLKAPAAVSEAYSVIKAADGTVLAINNKNGQTLWQVNHQDSMLQPSRSSQPVLDAQQVIVGFNDGTVAALAMQSGVALWQQYFEGAIIVTPLIDGQAVYAASRNHGLDALNKHSGEHLWHLPINVNNNLVQNQNFLFFIDDEHSIDAVNKQSGKVLWRQTQFSHNNITRITADASHLRVTFNNNKPLSLALDDGEVL